MRFVVEVEVQNDGGLRMPAIAEHIKESLYEGVTADKFRYGFRRPSVLFKVKDVQWLP